MKVYESRPEIPKEGDIHVYSNRGKFIFIHGNPDVMLYEGNIAAEMYQNDRWNNIKRIKINTRYLDSQGERETLDHIITYFERGIHKR
jgi:hypothetical protein